MINAYNKDVTRLDILQEVGKICYYMRDYESAYQYYNKFLTAKKEHKLDIYKGEDAKIAVVLAKVGKTSEAENLFKAYLEYAENDKSIYKELSLAMYYSYTGDTQKALEHLKLFSQQDNYHYWTMIFVNIDPLVDNLKELPEFQQLMEDIEKKFWKIMTGSRLPWKRKNYSEFTTKIDVIIALIYFMIISLPTSES